MIINNKNSTYDFNNTKNEYSNLKSSNTSSFNQLLNSKISSQKDEEIDISTKLLKDIESLFKTGLTNEELELLQKLMDEIIKNHKKLSNAPSNDELKKIQDLFSKLEDMIFQLKKKAKKAGINEINFMTSSFKDKLETIMDIKNRA